MEIEVRSSTSTVRPCKINLPDKSHCPGPDFRDSIHTTSYAGNKVQPSALALTDNDTSDCTIMYARRIPRLHPPEAPSAQHRPAANRTLPSRYLRLSEDDAVSSQEYHDTADVTHREPL